MASTEPRSPTTSTRNAWQLRAGGRFDDPPPGKGEAGGHEVELFRQSIGKGVS